MINKSDNLMKKTIYRSLCTSIVCIMLLIVTFATMTWAYFSDDVSSSKNSISTGSFNVEVYEVISPENFKKIEGDALNHNFSENTVYRFVKNGNTPGYFKAEYKLEEETKYCYGVFDEKSADQSYYDLTVNTNGETEFKLIEVNWGSPSPSPNKEEKLTDEPKLMTAKNSNGNEDIETIYLTKDGKNELTFGSSYLAFDSNISRLKDGYQEIAYLDLNGQFINLDIEPKNTLRFVVNNNNFDNYENLASVIKTRIIDEKEEVVNSFKVNYDGSVTIDNEEELSCIALFGNKTNDDVNSNFVGKIYSVNIFDNTDMIYEFVPARFDDKCGLYDLISDKFFELNGEYVNDLNDVCYINNKLLPMFSMDTIEDQEIIYNSLDKYEILNEGFSADGLVFEGYSLTKNGELITPDEDGLYYFDTKNGEKIILYAKYSFEEYNISYDLDGGSLLNKIETYDIANNVVFEEPIKENYIFDGYYLDKDYTQKIVSTNGQLGDLSVYVKWNVDEIEEESEKVEENIEETTQIEENEQVEIENQ